MKVTSNTFDRLEFTMGIPHFFCSECVFDRALGTATIARKFFFISTGVKTLRLADIDRVILIQPPSTAQERMKGEAEQPYPEVIMRDATRFRLASTTGVGAKWAAEAINAFLQYRK